MRQESQLFKAQTPPENPETPTLAHDLKKAFMDGDFARFDFMRAAGGFSDEEVRSYFNEYLSDYLYVLFGSEYRSSAQYGKAEREKVVQMTPLMQELQKRNLIDENVLAARIVEIMRILDTDAHNSSLSLEKIFEVHPSLISNPIIKTHLKDFLLRLENNASYGFFLNFLLNRKIITINDPEVQQSILSAMKSVLTLPDHNEEKYEFLDVIPSHDLPDLVSKVLTSLPNDAKTRGSVCLLLQMYFSGSDKLTYDTIVVPYILKSIGYYEEKKKWISISIITKDQMDLLEFSFGHGLLAGGHIDEKKICQDLVNYACHSSYNFNFVKPYLLKWRNEGLRAVGDEHISYMDTNNPDLKSSTTDYAPEYQ